MKYYVWPNGFYISENEYSEIEYSSFGDDYQVIEVPDTLPDLAAIECFIASKFKY